MTTSGEFYREVENVEHLQPGDKIDYRSCLTSWNVSLRKYPDEDPYILKLTCKDVPGLEIKDMGNVSSIVLGECQLTVTFRIGKFIEVSV